MKIAINTRFLQKGKLEGIGIYTQEICSRLVKNHPEIQFHFFFDRPFDREFIYGTNVVPHVLFPPARHPLLWWWWFEVAVYSRLNKIGADVFFSPDMFLSLRSECRTLLTSHDLSYVHLPGSIRHSHLRYFERYFPLFHQRADKVICVSEFTRRDVIDRYNIEPDKVFTVHNAARNEFQPAIQEDIRSIRNRWTEGRPYFLYLGAIHPRKNISNLLKAYGLFRKQFNRDVPLILAGRMAWKTDDVLRALKASPYRNDIVHIPDPEGMVVELVAAAKAMLYLSFFEGFGLPVVESMQSGVPVLASDIEAIREVAGDAALLSDPNDPAEIASAMNQIVTNEGLRNQLISAGYVRAAMYNWDKSSVHVFNHLASLAETSNTNK